MNTKTKHLHLLNEVQAVIIAHANAAGINLADIFATVEDFKKFVVGFAFRGMRDAGADVATAFDAVCGNGAYDALFARVTDKGTAAKTMAKLIEKDAQTTN